jgi:hypothetical protein
VTVAIYDIARVKFANGLMDWHNDPMAVVIPKTAYFPLLATDTLLGHITPIRSERSLLFNQSVDANGWFLCDSMVLTTPPIGLIDRVVIYRLIDETLVLTISFPPQAADGKPLMLLPGLSHPGICRL